MSLVKWSISDCHVDMLFSIPSLGSIPPAIIHSVDRPACVSCLLFGYLSVTVHAMLRLWIVLIFVSFSYVYSQQWTKSQKVREKKQKIGRKEEQIKRKAMIIQISKQIWIFSNRSLRQIYYWVWYEGWIIGFFAVMNDLLCCNEIKLIDMVEDTPPPFPLPPS